mgnify:CR=1 FL=1
MYKIIDIFIDVPVVNRFAKSYIGSQMGEDISTGRFDLYEIAYKAFSQSPIFGIGAGLFKEVTHAYTDVHNAYLQVLCEQGIIGLILFSFSSAKYTYRFNTTIAYSIYKSDAIY